MCDDEMGNTMKKSQKRKAEREEMNTKHKSMTASIKIN
jgi:hypothetical protein